jgi:chromosome segregation ATPase
MAETEPLSNATNAAVAADALCAIARPPLASLNGNVSRGRGTKPSKVRKTDAKLDLERQKTKSALKELADSESKLTKLGELLDKRGLKVAELQMELKAAKKASVADLSLQKKIHKKESKVENALAFSKIKAQVSIVKDVEASKKALLKKFTLQEKTLQSLQKGLTESKRRGSELSADIMLMSRGKDSSKEEIKALNKTINNLKKKVDDQLVDKNAHDLQMQRMKNQHKQMGLDELREKLTNKKSSGGATGPMSLEQKMDFVTHQAHVKQQSKDADLARAYHQKEMKKKDNQSNLGYAVQMLHSTSNLNGGNWSSSAVGDVSIG